MLSRFKDHFKKLKEILPIVDEVTLSKKSSKYDSYNHVSKPVHSDALRIYSLENHDTLGFAFIDILEGIFIITLKQGPINRKTISIISCFQLKSIFSTFFNSQSKNLEEFISICKRYSLNVDALKAFLNNCNTLNNNISDVVNKVNVLMTAKNNLMITRLQSKDYLLLIDRRQELLEELSNIDSKISLIKRDFAKSPEIASIDEDVQGLLELKSKLDNKQKIFKNIEVVNYLISSINNRIKS